jgi:hypothetical protein
MIHGDLPPGRFKSIGQIKAANRAYAKRSGRAYWFEPGAMRFFNTELISGPHGGRFFVTRERMDDRFPWGYSIRRATDEGEIETVGEMGQYGDEAAARVHIMRLEAAAEDLPEAYSADDYDYDDDPNAPPDPALSQPAKKKPAKAKKKAAKKKTKKKAKKTARAKPIEENEIRLTPGTASWLRMASELYQSQWKLTKAQADLRSATSRASRKVRTKTAITAHAQWCRTARDRKKTPRQALAYYIANELGKRLRKDNKIEAVGRGDLPKLKEA